MAERIGVEQYVSFIHQQESIFIRLYANILQCLNGSWQGIVCNGYLYERVALRVFHNILFLDSLVNAQHGNIVLSVDGLVLDQRHIRHGNKGRNRIADG